MRKSNKAKRADKLNVRHAKEVTYNYEAKERPATWAARMPAYCYTELCPVAEMRTARKRKLNLASGAGEEN